MIKLSGLSKRYRSVRALDRLDLTIERGIFGLLGPNGAGKTTLMRILATLLAPTSGVATVFGHDVVRARLPIRKLLGYLPQEFGGYLDFSGRGYLEYIAALKGMRRPKQRIETVLEQVRLVDVARRKTKAYSGGMLRRLGIAQALLSDPQLLIVDEPTSGLDPEERSRFKNLLVTMGDERLVILSTHLVEDVAMAADRLAVLCKGKVLYQGPVEGLIDLYRGEVYRVIMSIEESKERIADWTGMILTSRREDGRVILHLHGNSTGGNPVTPSLEDAYLARLKS